MSSVPRRAVPADVLSRLRLDCLDLPSAREQAAWTGTRWNIGSKNFAHVLMIDAGWPPAYVRAAGTSGPACVLTFRQLPGPCAQETRGPGRMSALAALIVAGVVSLAWR